MDVRCEKCQTEYEFDDARITEAGVTVKCTTCGHVFKVKKKALVITVPVKEGAGAEPVPASSASSSGSSTSSQEKQREWKVKQANGNVFTFKELTTLQKWIVERKVSRDDEISLTGESWKRLGNIAELASFFQVVEEAQKAAQLSALQSGGYLAYNPPGQSGPYPMPTVPSPQLTPPPAPLPPVPAPVAAPPPPPAPVVAAPPPPVAAPPPLDVAPPPPSSSRNATQSFGQLEGRKAPVRSAQRRAPVDEDEEYEAAGLGKKRGGGTGKFLGILLVLALLGGGGYYGYFHYWLPMEQQKAEDERLRKEKEDQDRANAIAADAEKNKLIAVEDAGTPYVDAGAPYVDAGAPEVIAVVDAGAPYVDAGTPVVKKEPVRDYDWYLAQGDRLRDREKAEAALDMYGKAADMEPDRAEPIAGRGLALLDMGQKIPAEAAFQQALKINSRYGVAIMGLAETYRAMGKKADAIKWYERYLDVLPNGPEAPVATEAIRRLKSE